MVVHFAEIKEKPIPPIYNSYIKIDVKAKFTNPQYIVFIWERTRLMMGDELNDWNNSDILEDLSSLFLYNVDCVLCELKTEVTDCLKKYIFSQRKFKWTVMKL